MQIQIKRGREKERADRKQEADSLFIYANIYAVATVCAFKAKSRLLNPLATVLRVDCNNNHHQSKDTQRDRERARERDGRTYAHT